MARELGLSSGSAEGLQADATPVPVLRLAREIESLLKYVEIASREGGKVLPAQSGVPDIRPKISPAAAPRPGNGNSALKVESSAIASSRRRQTAPEGGALSKGKAQEEETEAALGQAKEREAGAEKTAMAGQGLMNVAEVEGAPAGTRIASAASPREGQGESALITGSSPNVQKPKRNRASATANMATQVAQGPNGNGKANGNGNGKDAEGTGFSTWKIPPIRWGGDLSFNLSSFGAQGQPRNTQVFESTAIRADSYVFQPWFARVNGMLRLTQTNEGLTKRLATGNTGSSSVSGNGTLAMFPVSRFPFTAIYDVSDTRNSGQLVAVGYTARRLGLRQSYRPLSGNDNYSLSFDRSAISSDAGGTDIAKSLVGETQNRIGFHVYNANISRYTNTRSNTGDNSQIDRITVNHSYRPRSTFSLDNSGNMGTSKFQQSSSGIASDNRSRYLQLNSFATWRPEDNSPLLVTGGARLFESSSSTNANGPDTDSRTIAANAGATYTLNRNTMLTGAGTVTQASSAGRSTTLTNLSGGFNYSADAIRLGENIYTWGGGAGASRQEGGDQGSRNAFTASIRHGLNRSFHLADNSDVGVNANQSLSKTTGFLSYQTLVSSAGAMWNLRPNDATTTLLGAQASDSRTTGAGNSQHFQMLNLQANGQMQINRSSSGGANLTVQGTRQTVNAFSNLGTPATPTSGFNWTSNGSLNYQHSQAFGVPRLRYTALFTVNQFQNRTRFEGDINAPIVRVNKSFEQRFNYNIGRTETELLMRFAEQEGRSNNLILFRIMRTFGAY